jgi:crossover junction endodeoxyribonuclease RusA
MIVVLPWPPKELSPNARTHWARKAKAAKSYRNIAAWMTPRGEPGRTVSITFNPPDLRPRDLDNMLASIKSGLDGIASAIGIDDSQWSLTITKGEPVKGGLVTVEVTA